MAEQSKHVSKGMDNGQLVIISFPDSNNSSRVKAPLPDNFGISVGSEYTDPYNQNMTDSLGGIAGSILSNVGRFAGVSRKLGVATTIFYSGPEPTEISFDLEFSAYYDAKKEVVEPIKNLMRNSVGRELTTDDLSEDRQEQIVGGIQDNIGDEAGDLVSEAALIKGPSIATIRFGKTLKIQRCYIQSVGVQFSNVLDNQFYPVHGVASVTARIEQNPVRNDVDNMFNRARG